MAKASFICILFGILLGATGAYILESARSAEHAAEEASLLASVGINRTGTVRAVEEGGGSLTVETFAPDEPEEAYLLRLSLSTTTKARALYRDVDETGTSPSWGWLPIETSLTDLTGVPVSVSFGYNGQNPLSPIITAVDYLPSTVPDSIKGEPADGTKSKKTGTVLSSNIDQGFLVIESADEYNPGRVVRRYVHVSNETLVLESDIKEVGGIVYELRVEGGLSLPDIRVGDPVVFAYTSKGGRVEATCIHLRPVIELLNVNDDFCRAQQ